MVNQPDLTLAIFSFIIVAILGINAFFLKDILKNLNDLKLVFTKLNTEHGIYSEQVMKHERELDKIRERLHSLEGGQLQTVQFIKDMGHS